MKMIRNYLSLIKFSHTIFAMPFAFIGFFLAAYEQIRESAPGTGGLGSALRNDQGQSLWLVFVLVLLCMVFARSAAMAFNRYLDRHFDALNPRTAIREIPRGIIRPGNALLFTVISCLFFMASCYFINRLCFYLSPVALLVVLGYSYTKRFTPLCHLVLGLGLSLAPVGAYIAVTGAFHWLPILFSAAVLFWVSGFDIIYALQDVEFDRSQKLYSIPAAVGKSRALMVSRGLHLLSAVCIMLAGLAGFGWLYWLGAAVFAACLVYQQSLVRAGDLSRVNLAFMTTNGIASVIFAVFVIADLFIHH